MVRIRPRALMKLLQSAYSCFFKKNALHQLSHLFCEWSTQTASVRLEDLGYICIKALEKLAHLSIEFFFCHVLPHFQDGEVSSEEFKKGIEKSAKGKSFGDLPAAFKFFIDAQFRTIDVDGENRAQYLPRLLAGCFEKKEIPSS